jgi:hypothetical protein
MDQKPNEVPNLAGVVLCWADIIFQRYYFEWSFEYEVRQMLR